MAKIQIMSQLKAMSLKKCPYFSTSFEWTAFSYLRDNHNIQENDSAQVIDKEIFGNDFGL